MRLYHEEYPWAKESAHDPFPGMVESMSDDKLVEGIRIGRSKRYKLSEAFAYRYPPSLINEVPMPRTFRRKFRDRS